MSNKRIFIADLTPNQFVEGVYALQNCQLGQTKTGKPYIKCLLGDKSGRTPGRMWNTTEELFASLPTDGFAWVQGQSQAYQGEMQIVIQQMEAHKPTETEILDLLPSTQYDIDEMFAEVSSIMLAFTNVPMRELARAYLTDSKLMDRFKRAPAAMSLHHAFIGGLLEHTLQLLRLAKAVCPLYPQLNQEVVLMGLFLHDLGKCMELTWESGFGYSDDGQLVGHVARGVIWLQRKADDAAALGHKVPEPLLRVLHHIILSHHGQPEFGALKIPSTAEALAVSLLDNCDAKLFMAISATRTNPSKAADLGGNFTEKIWALDTRLYRPDPTTVEDDQD